MIIETTQLQLNETETELLSGVLSNIISKFYKDEKNLIAFKKEKKSLRKEVKDLEAKRAAYSKK